QRLVDAINALLNTHTCGILLVPMHMAEDQELCRYLATHATQSTRVRVLKGDLYSPAEFRGILGRARAMVGFRLHSAIVATSSAVPSVNFYYVDKGRVYFEQIGQSHNALPVERVLEENFALDVAARVSVLLQRHQQVRSDIRARVGVLRMSVRDAFKLAMS